MCTVARVDAAAATAGGNSTAAALKNTTPQKPIAAPRRGKCIMDRIRKGGEWSHHLQANTVAVPLGSPGCSALPLPATFPSPLTLGMAILSKTSALRQIQRLPSAPTAPGGAFVAACYSLSVKTYRCVGRQATPCMDAGHSAAALGKHRDPHPKARCMQTPELTRCGRCSAQASRVHNLVMHVTLSHQRLRAQSRCCHQPTCEEDALFTAPQLPKGGTGVSVLFFCGSGASSCHLSR